MTTTSEPVPITTVTNTEYRIMRRLPATDSPCHAGEWHQWEHMSPKCARDGAERRLALYRNDRGEYRLEERIVVTMSGAWEAVPE